MLLFNIFLNQLLLLSFKTDTLNPDSKYDEDDDNADLSEEEADADGDATGEKNKQKREQVRILMLSMDLMMLSRENPDGRKDSSSFSRSLLPFLLKGFIPFSAETKYQSA